MYWKHRNIILGHCSAVCLTFVGLKLGDADGDNEGEVLGALDGLAEGEVEGDCNANEVKF